MDLTDTMKRNPSQLTSLVDQFKGLTLAFRECDLAHRDAVNRAVEAVQIPDFELAIAELRVVPNTGQEFVDGYHAPQPAARIAPAPLQYIFIDQEDSDQLRCRLHAGSHQPDCSRITLWQLTGGVIDRHFDVSSVEIRG